MSLTMLSQSNATSGVMFWSCFSLLWDTGYAQQWHKHTQAPNNGEITTQNTSYTPAKMCPSHIHFCPYKFKGHIQWAGSFKKKSTLIRRQTHTDIFPGYPQGLLLRTSPWHMEYTHLHQIKTRRAKIYFPIQQMWVISSCDSNEFGVLCEQMSVPRLLYQH